MSFDKILINNRKEQNKTRTDLAKESKMALTTVCGYENGVRPTLGQADKLLKSLGICLHLGKMDGTIIEFDGEDYDKLDRGVKF